MKKLYLISFGSSDTFRVYADSEKEAADHATAMIKEYLGKEFPVHNSLEFIEKADIHYVDDSDAAKYAEYPELDTETLKALEKHLKTEVEAKEAVSELNSNAKFSGNN